MFIGHFAVAFAAKEAAPRVSLGTLFFASLFLDLLWPLLLLLGLEHVRIMPGSTDFVPLEFISYPISHSLVAVTGWAAVIGLLHFAARRQRRDSLVLAGILFLHWPFDALVHRPDLPLYPGSQIRLGMGLWDSVPAATVLEFSLLAAGVSVYVRTTRAADRTGKTALWVLIGLLLLIWSGNIFGPPPPTERAIALAGLAQYIFIPWACWIDRHRIASPRWAH